MKWIYFLLGILLFIGCAGGETAVSPTSTPLPTHTALPTVEETAVPPTMTPTSTPYPTAIPTPDPAAELALFLDSLRLELNDQQFDSLARKWRMPMLVGSYPSLIDLFDEAQFKSWLNAKILPLEPDIQFIQVDVETLPADLQAVTVYPQFPEASIHVVGSTGWGVRGDLSALVYVMETEGVFEWIGLLFVTQGWETAVSPLTIMPEPEGLVFATRGNRFALWQTTEEGNPQVFVEFDVNISSNPSVTHGILAQSEQTSITLFDFATETETVINLPSKLLTNSERVLWLDDETAVLLLTDDDIVTQGSVGYVALLNIKSGTVTPLAIEANAYTRPTISAAGTLVVDINEQEELITWQNGEIIPISLSPFLNDRFLHNMSLSPDGSKLIGITSIPAPVNTFGLVLFDLATGEENVLHLFTPIPTDAAILYEMAWSSDGQWVAFGSPPWIEIESGVWLISADAKRKIHLGAGTTSPLWVDEGVVLFTAVYQGEAGLQLYDINAQTRTWLGDNVRILTRFSDIVFAYAHIRPLTLE